MADEPEHIPSSIQVSGPGLGDADGRVRHTPPSNRNAARRPTPCSAVTVSPPRARSSTSCCAATTPIAAKSRSSELFSSGHLAAAAAPPRRRAAARRRTRHRSYDLTTVEDLHAWLHLQFPTITPCPSRLRTASPTRTTTTSQSDRRRPPHRRRETSAHESSETLVNRLCGVTVDSSSPAPPERHPAVASRYVCRIFGAESAPPTSA